MLVAMIILGAIALMLWFWKIAAGGKEFDEALRCEQLINEAERRWPEATLSEALNRLYEETYKNLVRAKKQGLSIEHYIEDQRIIANERCRIFREEVELESGFKVVESARV